MRLPVDVIKEVCIAPNVEDPELCLICERRIKFGLKTIQEPIQVSNCCVFVAFLHTSFLNATTQRINWRDINSKKAQLDTIHRRAYYCRTRTFRSVQHFVVADIYHCTLLALAKEDKFLLQFVQDK